MNKQALLARLEKLFRMADELLTTVHEKESTFSWNKDSTKVAKLVDDGFFDGWRVSCLAYLETNFKATTYYEFFKGRVRNATVDGVKNGLIILNALKENLEADVEDRQIEPETDDYVSQDRIEELANLPKDKFDTAKLVELCKELDKNYKWRNYFAVGALLRTILDHIPPIFEMKNFEQVANNYKWGKSNRNRMLRLQKAARDIVDNLLHEQIKKVEVLPEKERVDFRAELAVLLGEIITILKS